MGEAVVVALCVTTSADGFCVRQVRRNVSTVALSPT